MGRFGEFVPLFPNAPSFGQDYAQKKGKGGESVMGRRRTLTLLLAALLVSSQALSASASQFSTLLFGGSRVYKTAGITVVVEGYLRPELSDDPAAYLSFWALRSDQEGVQASAQHLQGGVVIPRGNAVMVKIFIEPGNDDFDRIVLVHQYDPYAKFGMKELARFRGMYRELTLDTDSDLRVGCNAIRVFLTGKGRNRPAYLGVGIVVAPNPLDVKRQAQLITETGQGEYLVPQQPAEQRSIDVPLAGPVESESISTGTVVVTTTHPTNVQLLVDDKEVVTHEVRDRRVFENVPAGEVTIKVRDAEKWQVRGSFCRILSSGGTTQFDLERRSAR